MQELKDIEILHDNFDLNRDTVGAHMKDFPRFNDSLGVIKNKKSGYVNHYEIISSEFMMELFFEIKFNKVYFQAQVIEFLSMNKIELVKEFKLPKNYVVPSSPFEKSVLKFECENTEISFEKQKTTRHIRIICDDKKFGKCEIDLTMIDGKTSDCLFVESMSLPSEFSTRFHNLCMATSGFARFGSLFFNFSTKKNIGNFTFEQNQFPKKYSQIKCVASGSNEKSMYGFSFIIDEFSSHSNALMFDNEWRKIGKITVKYNENDLNDKWSIESENEFVLEMLPISTSRFEKKALFCKAQTTRIYGYFCGKMMNNSNEFVDVSDIYSYIDIVNFD